LTPTEFMLQCVLRRETTVLGFGSAKLTEIVPNAIIRIYDEEKDSVFDK